jgi:competence ComEA-like helix-hairpin-helix protein
MKTNCYVQAKLRRPASLAIMVSGLLLIAILAALVLTGGASPLNAQPAAQPNLGPAAQSVQQRAILGYIYAVERFGSGLTVVTVQDQNGEQLQLEVRDEITIVAIPGQGRSLAQDLQPGSTVAALALQRIGATNINTASDEELQLLPQMGPARTQAIVRYRSATGAFGSVSDLLNVPGITQGILDSIRPLVVVNDWLLAQQIMSKPAQAVLHFHVTGVVVRLSPSEISVLDADGNLITMVLTLGGASGISPGEPVTVAVRYDAKLDTYTAVDIDRVEGALQRLTDALAFAEAAGHTQNAVNLRLRLVDAVGRVSAALKQAVDRTPGVRQPVQSSIGDMQNILRNFGLYGPVVTVTGIVDLVDPVGGYLGITDETGLAIDLIVAEETVIRDGNVDVALNAELFGRRIMVTYDPSPDSLRAHRVELVRDTGLPSHIIEQLAASATEGEAEGTVVQTNLGATPGFIFVQLDDGTRLPLNVVPGAGYVTGLASFHGSRVAVRFDPYTFDLQYIQRSRPMSGETSISGVVIDLDLKESKEIDIAGPGGTVLTVTWVTNAELQKDSLPINPSDISVGDVVRPTSRYLASDVTFLAIRKLDLIAPVASITGPVLGVDTEAGRVTILPDNGQIVTVLVNPNGVVRDGEPDTLDSLRPGERLALGSLYNPLTSVAERIVIRPGKVARLSGTIVDRNPNDFILTVTPDGANYQLVLLVPNKPNIVNLDGDPTASFHDLQVNNRADSLIYRYDDNVVVELMVSSR